MDAIIMKKWFKNDERIKVGRKAEWMLNEEWMKWQEYINKKDE